MTPVACPALKFIARIAVIINGGNSLWPNQTIVVQIKATHLGFVEVQHQAAAAAAFGEHKNSSPDENARATKPYERIRLRLRFQPAWVARLSHLLVGYLALGKTVTASSF